jgi:hypothetical protein
LSGSQGKTAKHMKGCVNISGEFGVLRATASEDLCGLLCRHRCTIYESYD